MPPLDTESLTITEVRHLPIVKAYAQKIGLVETIDRMVGSQMELSPGMAVFGMVLDTLSGRTPLYRLTEFFEEKDTELLLGTAIEPERFCDTNLGRSMDQIFETGTQKVFSQIAQNALTVFAVDPRRLHFDTTSVSVFGDYHLVDPPFEITYGYSKDKRPDLKQFLVSMLCVDRNIPILGTTTDGNASDKTLNNELLTNISAYMARHGLEPGAYVYVADSAFVTEDNLKKADRRQTWFLTRLPATYKECGRIIREAVAADDWIDIGRLAEERDRPNRSVARYRAYDGTVELYGKTYRAIVVHSSAHDKRRHKRIDRMLKQDRKQLEKDCKKLADTVYYCQADAQVALDKLIRQSASSYHRLQAGVEKIPKYGRGRPAAGKPRKVLRYEYRVTATVVEAPQKVQPLREEAGCFVLLTNLLDQQGDWSAPELLSLYKSQIGIEKNFSFLKDPAIVNSIFLKKAQRIEVLGLVLLISLLIWRLMERSMRQYVETNDCELPGWVRRKTRKPTSFMMTTKFSSIMVVSIGNHRQLAKPLKAVQLEYLKALGVTTDTFTAP
ncbi:IS4 family transposase [Desulfosarcina alkanivorans]|uniref:IS4 family transposase n=1 Tax=Desulfosarcina alkanivorans TaxID=571177 RepID=A0A5K7YUM5_9BACT|nr:IS1634 family transposase [Desulfosarcina alkanivorans]BBO66667.1 IS4 family transposase [Desulfosarcina alkanivorans]BBO68586.1 IS4 family transposase [Desulfosarcina alkanivorans]BBO69786.1 IS4 family transposase [Desulfosarcina alkanivorans]BBO69824.1 IS4 family transposase [Desulfosarcina alkanivorans]BBO71292.1 IS4 family transposase [Desulfosarcina alkanivorans]